MSVAPVHIPASYRGSVSGAPRALVVIAGTVFVPVSFEIGTNNYSASDTASVVLAMHGEHQSRNYGYRLSAVDFGAATQTGKPYPIEIHAGFPRDPSPGAYSVKDLHLQFSGIVDTFDWDYLADTVSISCRSFAALFLNTRTTAKWNNLTTTAVAQQLAKQQGLSASVNVSKPASMQTVYARDFVTGTQNMDEWSLLQAMARVDNAELFVRGTTLYYRDRLKVGAAPKYALDWESNLTDVKVQHAPQFSQLVKVNVKAWSPMTRTGVHSTIAGLAGQQPLPGTQRTGVSTSSVSPVFGTRTSVSSGSHSLTVNGVPISSGTSSGSTTKSGGSFSSGWTSMPKGPSALEYTYHVHLTDDASGSAQSKADDLARKIWIAISAHLFQVTAEGAVTPDLQSLLNQDTIWHLNGPVPSHNLDYYGRRVSQTWDVSQGEGESTGWTYSVEAANVPIVEQSV